jgi:hypothetical protein
MKRIMFVSLIALLILEAPLLTSAKQYDWPKPPTLEELSEGHPEYRDLLDYYKSQKKGILRTATSYLGGPGDIFPQERNIILHDIGSKDNPTSKTAKQYLLEYVIQPLREKKEVGVQDERMVLSFEELDRLSQAQLLYYYVRDHIFFPEEAKGGLSRIPLIGRIPVSAVTGAAAYPCEVISRQEGECMGKTMTLAALLKLCGYDVALGFFPSFVLRGGIGPIPGGTIIYHNYVFLRDEGWGIGGWELEKDFRGKEMGGDWILLDTICSPEHIPHMEMVGGEPRVLEFGDNPVWAEHLLNDSSTWGTDKFCWFWLDFENDPCSAL